MKRLAALAVLVLMVLTACQSAGPPNQYVASCSPGAASECGRAPYGSSAAVGR